MNPNLDALRPYPFERLDALKKGVTTESNAKHVSLALGEPKHAPPAFVLEALQDSATLKQGLMSYPPTRGGLQLREAIACWLKSRYGIKVCADTEILPVNGTREALFSLGQAVLSGRAGSYALFPNPFYQIYEGATLLRGTNPWYVPGTTEPDFRSVAPEIWTHTDLVYICTPGNPSGSVMDDSQLQYLIEKALEYDFVVASDECYSEVYLDELLPPLGLLEVASKIGNEGFRNCIAFNSLSKRSNLPGLRSGFAAGDAALIEKYYTYRTYHGCAMPQHVQYASTLAWQDEEHVRSNRGLYRAKFDALRDVMAKTFDAACPAGAFYYWPDVRMDDELFASEVFRRLNITVLPGSYLGREFNGDNPGRNHVRIALVAPLEECVTAVQRLCDAADAIRR